MLPAPPFVERFARDLDALVAPGQRVGVAVSGGPDSLALLLLATTARPSLIEAATVDHALRSESAAEAAAVQATCERLGIHHDVLTVEWAEKPGSGIQEKARQARYHLLAGWASERGLSAVATAHHLEDQAETLLMRLARGAGARGLAAMRPATTIPGCDLALVRPLLGWRRAELADICADAGVQPVADPSNEDDRFERVRLRHELGQAAWLDPEALAASAAHLRDADVALDWATQLEWARSAHNGGAEIVYRPTDAPPEIRRRIVQAAIARLASEGQGPELRGRELDRLMTVLTEGNVATARGVRCAGGEEWRFSKAPQRRA